MSSASKAIVRLIKIEGGLVKLPDGAGLTKYGITEKTYPDLDIEDLTIEQATRIYKLDWWDKMNLDKIGNQEIAEQLLNHAVNSGIKPAVKVLQKMLNVSPDGIVGAVTIDAINKHTNDHLFVCNYKLEIIRWYKNLARKPKNKNFLYLWVSRIFTE
jgi:lysozyme family protein